MKAIYTGGSPESFKTEIGYMIDQLNKTGLLNKEIDVVWDDKNECFSHGGNYFHTHWLTFPEKIKGIYHPDKGPERFLAGGGRPAVDSSKTEALDHKFSNSINTFEWNKHFKCYRYNGCYFLHPAWIEVVEDEKSFKERVKSKHDIPEIKFKSCAEIINKIEELKNGKGI